VETLEPRAGRRPLELTGSQKTLAKALSDKDLRLGEMYRGALIAFANSDNPESLAQACHSLRELMEKIPQWYEAVPAPEQLPRLNDKVSALEEKWKRMIAKTKCVSNGAWTGSIDRSLEVLLMEIEEFFSWHAHDKPMRKERTAVLFRQLDPLRLPLPTKIIEESRVEEWSECRNYFVQVSHHNRTSTPEECSRYVYFLEGFLLDLIRPRTFEKHKEMDEIIERGEQNANR
jgi:hypothetical protein